MDRQTRTDPVVVHDLRHTCASLLASNGASPKSVQSWLGHQDLRVTMNTYTHTFAADLSDAAINLDRLVASSQNGISTE